MVAFSVAVLAAVAYPLGREPGEDSFPLSTYPMFARSRPGVAAFDTALGFDAAGGAIPLGTRAIGGTAEPVHAAVTVQRAIDEGRAPALCAEIAARVAHDGPEAVAVVEVVRLEVAMAGFDGYDEALPRTVAARCPVLRTVGR